MKLKMNLEDQMEIVGDYANGKLKAGRIDKVGIVLFNQPEKRNAVSLEMWEGVCQALDLFEADNTIRAVVYTGAGDKSFVSGADISQFAERRNSADANEEYQRLTGIARDRVIAFTKPSIACIRGFCLGAGLVLAMRADLRVADQRALLGLPAARLSLAFNAEAAELMVQLVGPAHARMMLYTARRFTAQEAAGMGLVDVVAEDASQESLALARTIANNGPLSVAHCKLVVSQALKDRADRDEAAVEQSTRRCMDSADFREGRVAFMEKREPVFTGA